MRLLIAILAVTTPGWAEFLTIRMDVEKMDCASCVKSLESGLKRIRGVEKVTVTASGVDMTLAEGNRVTLDRVRDTIKGIGFTPAMAHVTAKGKAITGDGMWRFELDGGSQPFTLSAQDTTVLKALHGSGGKVIVVKGTSPAPPDPRTPPVLDVRSIEGQ